MLSPGFAPGQAHRSHATRASRLQCTPPSSVAAPHLAHGVLGHHAARPKGRSKSPKVEHADVVGHHHKGGRVGGCPAQVLLPVQLHPVRIISQTGMVANPTQHHHIQSKHPARKKACLLASASRTRLAAYHDSMLLAAHHFQSCYVRWLVPRSRFAQSRRVGAIGRDIQSR